jgi:hypothetical protein
MGHVGLTAKALWHQVTPQWSQTKWASFACELGIAKPGFSPMARI